MRVMGRSLSAVVASAVLSTGLFVAPAHAASVKDRFYRETVSYGAKDKDVNHIAHVLELEYRLKWLGLYTSSLDGSFGSKLRTAVKAFQKKYGLSQTGVADQATWAKLLPATIRGTSRIPSVCKSAGWHACYDRTYHQVVLYRNAAVLNTWLVRGGGSTTQTRTGNSSVYYRDKDHVSSLYDSKMPYAQFFDGGEALHGSVMMMNPFSGHSHGCVNFYIEDASQLWTLTAGLPLKTLKVHVYGAWS